MKRKAIVDWREAVAFCLMHNMRINGLRANGEFTSIDGLEDILGRSADLAFENRQTKYKRDMQPMSDREVLVHAAQAIHHHFSNNYDVEDHP